MISEWDEGKSIKPRRITDDRAAGQQGGIGANGYPHKAAQRNASHSVEWPLEQIIN